MARQRYVDWDAINKIIEERKALKLKIDELFKKIKELKRGEKKPIYEEIAALRCKRDELAKQAKGVRENKSQTPLQAKEDLTDSKQAELKEVIAVVPAADKDVAKHVKKTKKIDNVMQDIPMVDDVKDEKLDDLGIPTSGEDEDEINKLELEIKEMEQELDID